MSIVLQNLSNSKHFKLKYAVKIMNKTKRRTSNLPSWVEWNIRPSCNLNSYNSSQLHSKKWKHTDQAWNQHLKQARPTTRIIIIMPNKFISTFYTQIWRKKYLIEITIRDDGELLLDRLQKPDSNVKAVVGCMRLLTLVPHRTKGTSSLCATVISTSWVPPDLSQDNPNHHYQTV